jgi:hypothetical protein
MNYYVTLVFKDLNVAMLNDNSFVPITSWYNADGECDASEATACVCGPTAEGKWISVDLREWEPVVAS